MAIRILVTGGTFDKEYNERTGQLYFKDTHLGEMLRRGRSRVEVTIRTVMMIDSLEMTDADRAVIVQNCQQAQEDRIVITHGTDTMTETAAAGGACHLGENRGAHWRDDTVGLWQLRWTFQSRQRALFRASAASGCLCGYERQMLSLDRVRKNRERGEFEEYRRDNSASCPGEPLAVN